MSAEAAHVVLLRRTESEDLAHHALEVLRSAHGVSSAGEMSADQASQLRHAAYAILAILGDAEFRPANVIDLAQVRRHRRR